MDKKLDHIKHDCNSSLFFYEYSSIIFAVLSALIKQTISPKGEWVYFFPI
ncbi:hypothetical protein AO364_0876 [Moraxella catarrhalis]|nr:hypothetical protein AO364_0876 [Moraxella catarrhalis]